ncbi:type II secretion system protein GspL [Vibrio fluvialis]|uniref:type II secretion system protein GspL n=1 Tax=Vibrio fluvialis TaxID=676 RepID=UPI001EEC81EA|nr:type II secretion system protein GspL [Vibrio fluvialis]MCG6374299.1 type II secretion system protein GspL [Vibrio fluvialis]
MSEFLTVRLSSQQDATIPWLVWSPQQQAVIASGEVAGLDQLEELTPYAAQRSTLLLLAASDVVLTQVDIPSGASRQLESMLPYLVEDEIAQDVDELHFSVLNKSGGVASVAGVDRQWLQSCLDTLKALQFDVKRVLPDVLALPQAEGMAAVQLGDEWLVRKGEFSGLSVEAQWLPLFSQSDWVRDGEAWLPLTAYTPLPELTLAEGQDWRSEPSELVMQVLTQEALRSKMTLLTGEFTPKSSWSKYWLVWRKAAIAAGLLLVVSMGYRLVEAYQYETTAQTYRAESERIFRAIFPDKQRIPTVSYLKRQMSDELAMLSGGSSGEHVLGWLSKLPDTLRSISALQVQSLRFDGDRGEVRLEATSKDFQTFEQARVKFEENFAVEQGQLSKNGELVVGSYVLKRK